MSYIDDLRATLNSVTEEWKSPFSKTGVIGTPRNIVSHHIYTGVNWFIGIAWAHRHSVRPAFLTWKQKEQLAEALHRDIKLRKGEHGVQMIRPVIIIPNSYRKEGDDRYVDTHGKVLTRRQAERLVIKRFTVFSVDQLADPEVLMGHPWNLRDPDVARAKAAIVSAIKLANIEVNVVEAQAFYRPSSDTLSLPSRESVTSDLEWIATAFHELTHWTGHKDRLNRPFFGVCNPELRAEEELVAELGAAMLCQNFGLDHHSNAMAYCKQWAELIKDEKALIRAGHNAQQAVDYLLTLAGEMGLPSEELVA